MLIIRNSRSAQLPELLKETFNQLFKFFSLSNSLLLLQQHKHIKKYQMFLTQVIQFLLEIQLEGREKKNSTTILLLAAASSQLQTESNCVENFSSSPSPSFSLPSLHDVN